MKSLALFAALSAASAVLAQDSFTLKPTFEEGQVNRFQNTAQFDVMGLVIEARFVEVRKVVSKTAEEVTVENTWEDFVVVADGSEQEVPSSSTTTKYSLTGALISMSGDMVTSDAYRASMVDHFSYPETAVAVGDEWVKEHAGDSAKGLIAAKATYKVMAKEELMGMTVLKIQGDYKETVGSAPVSGSGHFWVNVANGQVVKTDRAWKNVPMAQAPVPLSGKVTSQIIID